MSPNHVNFIWFGDVNGTKPYELIGPGGFYSANTGVFHSIDEFIKMVNHQLKFDWRHAAPPVNCLLV